MRPVRLVAILALFALPVAFAEGPATLSAAPEVVPAPVAATSTAGAIAMALAPLEVDPIFQKAVVGVQVVDVASGEVVYRFGDDRQMVPASTMKTLTAATALKALGPSYRFPTWIMQEGEVDAEGKLVGNLYIKGQGDPTMVIERMWRMALDLKLHGVREVSGDVVFDDTYFADSTLIPGWGKQEDIDSGPTYFAPLGALSLNYNIAAITVRPGAGSGKPAVAEFDTPTGAVVLDGQVNTVSKNAKPNLKIEREVDATTQVTTFHVTGSYPAEREPYTYYRTLADPLGNYMGGFQAMLKQHGIKVRGSFRKGTTSKTAKLLFKAESDPLTSILSEMNKQSNNFIAEQVLRGVGAERYGLPGTTAKGVDAIAAYLDVIGAKKTEYHLVNGSGLSRDVTFQPSVLTRLLVAAYNDVEIGPEFVSTLAVGGRDGTLWARFRDEGMEGRVRGKTGTLTGVHCVAGYVTAVDRHTYAFSFLVNDIDGALGRAKKAQDRLVVTLAGVSGNLADGTDAAEEASP